jgi:hypothetical protein
LNLHDEAHFPVDRSSVTYRKGSGRIGTWPTIHLLNKLTLSSPLNASLMTPSTRAQLHIRTQCRKRSVALIRQEFAGHGDPHAITLRVLLAVDVHIEVDRAHDAVTELFLNERFPRCAVCLY